MAFQWFVTALAWASVVIFFVAAVRRVVKINALPMGLRWEVYPIPHEARDKREYGGSYMEDVDWAKRHRRRSFLQEVIQFLAPEAIEIGTEIATMKKVRAHNRYGIWTFSTLMHWGVYLFVLFTLLLIIGSLTGGAALAAVTRIVGLIACVAGLVGVVGLIVRRATSPDLANYTAPIDYFNLAFLGAIFVFGLISLAADPSLAGHRAYFDGVVRLRPAAAPWSVVATFLLFWVFVIYMPFSKLLHYIIKYFLYHQGLWDDAFKVKGSDADKQVARQLAYQVTWQAPHIVQGKTWLEEAQMTAAEGEKK
ncbi:MAG: respiratory nitrate reductase subunit gamma [Anaerolineae bacterium]